MFLLFQFLAMCFSRMNIFDRPMIFFILSQIHYHNPRQRKRNITV